MIASAGRSSQTGDTRALQANLAASNDKEALGNHYKELISNGLNPEKIKLVVTDLLPAYRSVIAQYFPQALHQYCIFHFIQHINQQFKMGLKSHRQATFQEGARKEAHLISWLLLKGAEKLTQQEQQIVFDFCNLHPNVAAGYALKEDIRTLYASVKDLAQAIAFKDILTAVYTPKLEESMQKMLTFFSENFNASIAYLQQGYFRDKTNNDAERMMRTIKKTQQTHYFLRNPENYIKKIKVVLGINTTIAT